MSLIFGANTDLINVDCEGLTCRVSTRFAPGQIMVKTPGMRVPGLGWPSVTLASKADAYIRISEDHRHVEICKVTGIRLGLSFMAADLDGGNFDVNTDGSVSKMELDAGPGGSYPNEGCNLRGEYPFVTLESSDRSTDSNMPHFNSRGPRVKDSSAVTIIVNKDKSLNGCLEMDHIFFRGSLQGPKDLAMSNEPLTWEAEADEAFAVFSDKNCSTVANHKIDIKEFGARFFIKLKDAHDRKVRIGVKILNAYGELLPGPSSSAGGRATPAHIEIP